MRRPCLLLLVCGYVTLIDPTTSRAQCERQEYYYTYYDNSGAPSCEIDEVEYEDCFMCDGASWTHCPQRMSVDLRRVLCDGTIFQTERVWGGAAAFCAFCPQAEGGQYDYPDGMILKDNCGTASCANLPNQDVCDGTEAVSGSTPVDRGCLDDEHGNSSCDSDPHPVRYSSGRVETQPITAFALPDVAGLSMRVELIWGSQLSRIPAYKRSGDSVPTVHSLAEDIHYLGSNWIDNMSDKLILTGTTNPAGTITWVGSNRLVTFTLVSGSTYKSTTGQYTLVDRGAATPKWVVTAVDAGSEPHQQWGFTEATYTRITDLAVDPTFKVAHLVRRAVTSGPSDYTGFYAITIARLSDNRIDTVTDTLGHQFHYLYQGANGGKFYRLTGVDYIAYPSASPVPVLTLTYSSLGGTHNAFGGIHLDRIEMTGTYRRFKYLTFSGACPKCDGLLTDVIAPKTAIVSTTPQAPIQATEVVLEHHDYENAPYSNVRPRAIRSSGPGRSFAYVYGANSTLQFDLKLGGAACTAGSCATGFQCFTVANGGDDKCYVANTYNYDSLRSITSTSSTAGGTSASTFGGINPRSTTDEAGIKTTYGYGTDGRLRCLVRNDDDDDAFVNPAAPDTSACDPPATGPAQVIAATSGVGSSTKTTPSILSSGQNVVTSETTSFPSRTITMTETGYTRNITGTLASETHTTIAAYDSQWRPTSVDGPLPNATAYDVTNITYHSTSGSSNYGHVHTVTRYVGNAGSHSPLTTTYSEYDEWGVPHRVTAPNGTATTYTPSTDRLLWDVTELKTTGGTIGTSRVQLNPDGTVKYAKDADGVCMTYEYTTAGGVYVGAPTVIKRSADATCGVVPISQSTGEVELRTYVNDDPSRLQSVTRQQAGVVDFTYSGFTYDLRRRVTGASTLDSAQSYAFGFTQGLPTSTTAPEAPGPGAWKTETTADAFGRPAYMWRWLNGADKQVYTFQYQTDFTPRPTRLLRGKNSAQPSVTDFVYDDFGRLLESVVPEQGTTRYEYDVAGNLVKERVGVGTALVRTSQRTYDSLGRLLGVDNDTEHPVTTCTGVPTGTPIQDEEYRYDTCVGDIPSGFSCGPALGSMTMSRVVLQCASNQTIKRGRWYAYNDSGRLDSVTFATVTGSTVGVGAAMAYKISPAGRVTDIRSPLTAAYATTYAYSGGLISGVSTNSGQMVADTFTYRSFGALGGFRTNVSIGSKKLQFTLGQRTDGAVSGFSWGTTTTSHLYNQTFTYSPAGLLTQRNDSVVKTMSRHYQYDALLRMTCEARGSSTTYPSASDCVGSSSRLAGLYTYHDGASATQPPDVRGTALLKATGYSKTAADTYSYAGGSGAITQVTRGASDNLVLGYDVLGRRTFDYDSFDSTRSRRDYTYLPNGQLGSISGRNSSNVAYSVAVNYDHDGRPLTISATGGGQNAATYELFYDDASRLIAAQIATTDAAGAKYIRWHYHHMGGTILAATREIQTTSGTTVKRFWFLTDERGLIYRALDDVGVEFFSATWDATGWRTIVTQAGGPIDMWVPFGLPGQLILDSTAAYASNGTTTHSRPPVALNRWRVHDPLLGAFLTSDPSDLVGRLDPEGYLAYRDSPLLYADPTGAESQLVDNYETWKTENRYGDCPRNNMMLLAETAAKFQIMTCTSGYCGMSTAFRRGWVFALATMKYDCDQVGEVTEWGNDALTVKTDGLYWDRRAASNFGAASYGYPPGGLYTHLPPAALKVSDELDPFYNSAHDGKACLSRTLAHEALHRITGSFPLSRILADAFVPAPFKDALPSPEYSGYSNASPDAVLGDYAEERLVHKLVYECVKCGVLDDF
jgi:YD repeat-containing protein